VGFRDETEAVRHRLQQLREELDELTDERDRLSAETRELDGDVEARAALLAGKSYRIWLFLGGFVAVAVVAALVVSRGSPGSETLYGHVRATTGEAPVSEGARCTAFLSSVGDDDSDYDRKLDVVCGDRIVYGGGSLGYLACEFRDEHLVRCGDPDFSADGGDPRLELLRDERRIRVEDRYPTWSVEIELTTPPSGIRGGP
jgi:hypothetical protein